MLFYCCTGDWTEGLAFAKNTLFHCAIWLARFFSPYIFGNLCCTDRPWTHTVAQTDCPYGPPALVSQAAGGYRPAEPGSSIEQSQNISSQAGLNVHRWHYSTQTPCLLLLYYVTVAFPNTSSNFSFKKKIPPGAEHMAQWIKYLPASLRTRIRISRTPGKAIAPTYHLSLPVSR